MAINKIVHHTKETVIREYCLARKIPYKFEGGALYIGRGTKAIFAFRVTLVPWEALFTEIDNRCNFNNDGDFESLVDN